MIERKDGSATGNSKGETQKAQWGLKNLAQAAESRELLSRPPFQKCRARCCGEQPGNERFWTNWTNWTGPLTTCGRAFGRWERWLEVRRLLLPIQAPATAHDAPINASSAGQRLSRNEPVLGRPQFASDRPSSVAPLRSGA